jgi:hypothetical protein
MIIGRRKTEDGKTMEWLPPSALLMLGGGGFPFVQTLGFLALSMRQVA